MIEVSWANLFLIPMCVNLAILAALCLYYFLKGPAHKAPQNMRIYRCGVCEHVYEDGRKVPLSRCPHCGCLNDPVKQ